MTRKAIYKSITFPEVTAAVVGDAAIVRHLYESESETDGKPSSTKIGALQIWQKRDGTWKLLARQGFKLARGSIHVSLCVGASQPARWWMKSAINPSARWASGAAGSLATKAWGCPSKRWNAIAPPALV